ncbi:hypothetical protein [Polyangium sp. 15x6]|uniref:hypothetical protein n=1 Tax=Polyangium sp. 15x6 TaxID=3042687 RepID=UPI00249B9367|nr:hypothetical protein [Polyangium sp. 15x6]MDI3285163.1 hypothetical protein [Polyangium sp. 15x6]
MLAALIPLLALVGVGIAVASRGAAEPAKPPPAPTPTGPATIPGQPTAAELTFFDIRADGTRVWKPQMRDAILQYLAQWGFVLLQPNDPTYIQLVPRKTTADATAKDWAELYAATKVVLTTRFLMGDQSVPKVLRAVAPGEEALWAGASSQATFAVLLERGAVPQQPSPQLPNLPAPPPAPATPDAFTPLGPELADQVRALMRDATDPTKLVLMADSLEGKEPVKYGPAAEALRKRAKELETQAELAAINSGRIYIVRPDDLQSELAQWYTGDANRWRELGKTNPKLRLMQGDDGNGRKFQYFAPWVAGDKIVLPPGWDVSKGLPPRRPRGEPKAAA